jgi:hypothetical protein
VTITPVENPGVANIAILVIAKRVATANCYTVTTATVLTIRILPGRLPFHLSELVTFVLRSNINKTFSVFRRRCQTHSI